MKKLNAFTAAAFSMFFISTFSAPAHACGPEVAQFIADVGPVTTLSNGACEFKIDLDLRKPRHQFSPMFTCPLDIDLLGTYPVRQDVCTVQKGDEISGVLVKMTPESDHLILE
ncbi:MAG: hypothetical protein U1E10_19055 [Bdellovibrionales bacterium]|nr:hypothetical protein [Bdellovibrionales bacterium]